MAILKQTLDKARKLYPVGTVILHQGYHATVLDAPKLTNDMLGNQYIGASCKLNSHYGSNTVPIIIYGLQHTNDPKKTWKRIISTPPIVQMEDFFTTI